MKKTKHTILTALTFTAALQMASASNVNAITEDELGAIGVQVPFKASEQEVQDVYGPPPTYDEPVTTAQIVETTIQQTSTSTTTVYGPPAWFRTTSTVSDIVNMTTTTMPAPVYGPPQMFYQPGDLNGDRSSDVFDVIYLRKLLLKNMEGDPAWEEIYADVNGDGEFNIADLVALQNYLLGKTPDLTTPPETTTTTAAEPTTTSTTSKMMVELMYGPPVIKTTTSATGITTTTETTTRMMVELMYGPPVIPTTFDWKDPLTTTKASTTKKPPKTTTTTTTTSSFEPIVTLDPGDFPIQLMYGPPEYFDKNYDKFTPEEK